MESAHVGVILDSGILIAAERGGQRVRQLLSDVRAAQGEVDMGLSVVTIAELIHGAYRAGTEARQRRVPSKSAKFPQGNKIPSLR